MVQVAISDIYGGFFLSPPPILFAYTLKAFARSQIGYGGGSTKKKIFNKKHILLGEKTNPPPALPLSVGNESMAFLLPGNPSSGPPQPPNPVMHPSCWPLTSTAAPALCPDKCALSRGQEFRDNCMQLLPSNLRGSERIA